MEKQEKNELEQKKFLNMIKNNCNHIFQKAELVYLFGSFAKSTYTSLSDIDFAFLFASKFDKHKLFEIRLNLIGALQKIIKKEVDIVTLNLAPPLLKFEAINGILLHEKNSSIRIDFEVKTIHEYLDTKSIRIINSQYLFHRISEFNV
ncbi:MAG: nucleotidyltransferase domain-containing protein [Candidatus Helarchaeota archaeon]|nr:nucleotidyltransferase domain-containing protein [Candidatus Helarchaeota archaeon]